MAVFSDSDLWYTDDSGQMREALDWALLKNGPLALFHRLAVLDDAVAWLSRYGYVVAIADCEADPSARGVLDVITAALGFPAGATLDGLNDYCWQLEVPDTGGFALVLLHYQAVAATDSRLAEAVLDIVAGAARDKLLFGRRLVCLVQSDDPRFSIVPVGGRAPVWNPREWFDKDRGL